MVAMNIFESDAFSMLSLTAAVEKVPFLPQFLGSLGIFEENPIRTTAAAIEEREGVLTLIPTSPRGSPPTQRKTEKRKLHYVEVPRIAKSDTIMADEIQNIRPFGSETDLMATQAEVARRMNGSTGLIRDAELTEEHMRLGAIQGIVLDADGATEIVDWFSVFGIAPATEIAFNLSAAADGDIRKTCTGVVRAMSRAGGGAFIPNSTRVVGLAGDEFWDDFTGSAEVRDTFKNWSAAAELRRGLAYETFHYGGIDWVNYRGTDDNSTVAVPTDKAKFFPVGAPGVFQVARSPAERFEFVNTLGRRFYADIVRDRDRDMWVQPEVYANPLYICTRPQMLQSGRAGA